MRVGDLTFRVLTSGAVTPDAATLVLVHGIGVSHRYLARLHRELSRTRQVISIDMPGFGGLPKPAASPTVAEAARALGVVLDRLGLAAPVLVGHSMGCQWVVELAAQRPELASHVVVMGPVCDDRHRTALAQSVALAVDTLGEPPSGNALVFVDYLRCGPRWYLRQLREMVAYAIEDRAALLTVPLLILRGGDDPIAGLDWCRRLRERVPDARVVVVPGHRHLVQHTAPRTVRDAIETFLDQTPSPTRSTLR